jgi:hypothetical protein
MPVTGATALGQLGVETPLFTLREFARLEGAGGRSGAGRKAASNLPSPRCFLGS